MEKRDPVPFLLIAKAIKQRRGRRPTKLLPLVITVAATLLAIAIGWGMLQT